VKKCPNNLIEEYMKAMRGQFDDGMMDAMRAYFARGVDRTACHQRTAHIFVEDADVFVSKRTGKKTKKVESKECLYLVDKKMKV
jgi:hypothetical protein